MSGRAAAAALVAALAIAPARAAAQCGARPEPCEVDAPRWAGELATLSANALLNGLTAGLVRVLRGGSFEEAFARGALGGAGTYLGKRIAVERFAGAGLLGREVAAAGTSISRNALDGLPLLERLILPLGPVRLYLRRGAPPRIRIDAVAAGWIAYGIAEPELQLDAGESLSAGAPVFRTRGTVITRGGDGLNAAGLTAAGVVLLSRVPGYGATFDARAFAHERVHVIQQDQLFTLWADPAAEWAAARWPPARGVNRWIDTNVSRELLRGLGRLIPGYTDRPWELEPIFLAR